MISMGESDSQSFEIKARDGVNSDVTTENWYIFLWRPSCAWGYLIICLFDFLIAPILTGVYFAYTKQPYVPWTPITLVGGGLFHLSFGAIIGVTAWGRTLEKRMAMTLGDDASSGPSYPSVVQRKYPSVSSPAQTSNTAPASIPGLDPNAPSSGHSSRFDP